MANAAANEFLQQEQCEMARGEGACGMGSLFSGSQNISDMERWGSMGAGGVLLAAGLAKGKLSGLLMSFVGGALLYRGITGHCHGYEMLGIDTAEHKDSTAVPAQQGVKLEKTITINCPREDLFRFWRNPNNLSKIMQHIREVRVVDNQRSHWVADGLGGKDVEWDAEIFNEREYELIAWRSLPGGDVETAGSVHFKPLGENRTNVTVSLKYNPPGGKLGATVASLFGAGAEQKIAEDLERFKEIMESTRPKAAPVQASVGTSNDQEMDFE